MQKRLHLKGKTKIKRKLLLFTLITIIIFSIFTVQFIGKTLGEKMIKYAEAEVSRIAKYVVNYAVTTKNIQKLEFNELFIISKNSNEEIQTVDFDPVVVNNILNSITETILSYFKAIEQGDLEVIDLSNSLLLNVDINKLERGIVAEIPIGTITDNALLSNLGPKIPVRLSIIGEIESELETEIKYYGINNALITIYVNIRVSEQIYMPIATGKVVVSQRIPIAIKLMQGIVPNAYFGNIDGLLKSN